MTYTAEKIRKMEPALIAKASPVHIENVIKDLIAYALAAPAVANGAAELPPLPEPAIEGSVMHQELKICYLAPVHFTADQMQAYGRAAIAASTQQAAPKQALTLIQHKQLSRCLTGGVHMGWISDVEANALGDAIEAAAVPNALLVAALKDCADIMLSNGLDECEAYESARAALESVPTASEATE